MDNKTLVERLPPLPEIPANWLAAGKAHCYTAEQMREYAAAALRATGEGEWVMVPREPTEAMLHAFTEGAALHDSWRKGYATMLAAAAPTQPTGEGEQCDRGFQRAWEAVAETLTEVSPGWDTPDGTCPMDRACNTIRALAAAPTPVTGEGEWANVPKAYVGRWHYDYDEIRRVFMVLAPNRSAVAETEESEVADAICKAHNAAIAAAPTPAEPTNPGEISSKLVEPLRDAGAVALKAALRSYRCQHTVDEDGNHLPLIDALTPEGNTILSGKQEIQLIADHVAAALIAGQENRDE